MTKFWVRTAIGLLVALPLLGLAFLRTDLGETADALGEAEYSLIAPAMALLALAFWLQAVRWRFLMKPLSDVPASRLFPVLLIGHLGNALLPLRGGEILRALVLKRREGVSRMATLGTLAVERALDGLALVGLLVISMAFVQTNDGLWGLVIAGAVIFGGATAALFAVAFRPERSAEIAEIFISRAPRRWRNSLRTWLESFVTGTHVLRTLGGVGAVLMTTAWFWAIVVLVYLIVGEAFHLHEGIGTYVLVTAAANLSVSVPSSQGGVGPFEFFVRQTLVFAGVATPVATAYAVALHAVLLIPMISLGLVSLWIVGLSFAQITHPADADAVEEGERQARSAASVLRPLGTSASRRMPEEPEGANKS